MKTINIDITTNKAYEDPDGIDYARIDVRAQMHIVTPEGETSVVVFDQCASESLSECPEDAYFGRDLNNPMEFVDALVKIIGDDPNYSINISTEVED